MWDFLFNRKLFQLVSVTGKLSDKKKLAAGLAVGFKAFLPARVGLRRSLLLRYRLFDRYRLGNGRGRFGLNHHRRIYNRPGHSAGGSCSVSSGNIGNHVGFPQCIKIGSGIRNFDFLRMLKPVAE